MLNFFSCFCFVYLLTRRETSAEQAYYDDCDNNMEQQDCCIAPQKINAASGRLCSPFFPDSYPENLHCEWKISSPVDSAVLEIRFEEFALELSPGCAYDYLEFRAVPETPNGNDRVLGKFCGENKPEKFTTPQNQVYVVFHSDVNNVCQGFCFAWRSIQATTTETTVIANQQEDELADPGEVICPDANIDNGNVECTNANNIGSTCTYTCVFGYSLTGFTTSTCVLPNGADQAAWLPALPTCIAGLSWEAIGLITLGTLGLLGLLCLCCGALNRGQQQKEEHRQVVVERPMQYVARQPQHHVPMYPPPPPAAPRRTSKRYSYDSNPCTGNPQTCPVCSSDSLTRRT